MGQSLTRWDVDSSVEVVAGIAGEVNDTSETLSAAINLKTSDRSRCKVLVIFRAFVSPTGAIAHGVTFAVKESATSAGSYTTATTHGDLTKLTAAGTQAVSVNIDPAKPFLKLSATGDDAATLFEVTGTVVFISPSV